MDVRDADRDLLYAGTHPSFGIHHPPSLADEKTEERRYSPATYKKIPRPLHGDTGRLDSGRCYLRRRTAYVRTPEPSSNAAAGRRIAGPPLLGSGTTRLLPAGPWVFPIVPSASRGPGLLGHHGGVLRQRNGRQDQHDQESGRSQEYRPLHPVLLFYVVFQSACICPSSSREGTHSVQNLNAKVSIILIIFNENDAKRPLKLPTRAAKRG